MSLLGERTAVVSLGASCQTARQIRLHADLLADRMGEALAARTMPFDWMFAPPDAAARLLRGPVRVPPTRAELVVAQRPFWPRHGIWFWHDDPAGDFLSAQARQQRRWDRFMALRKRQRRVFVVSNTQNNLAGVAGIAPRRLDFRLSRQRMAAVVEAVETLFGREGNEFLFVAYESRIAADARATPWPLALLQPDGTDHEGDAAAWRRAFMDNIA